ncbi:MAG: serpin family protein [Planctomycetota bacterium]
MQISRRQALRALAAAQAAALCPMSAACQTREEDPPDPEDFTLSEPTAVAAEGLASFAFDLHRATTATDESPNAFVSPWSIWTALAMLAEGARGETRAEIVAAMGLADATGAARSAGAGDLRERLARADRGREVSISTADALWLDDGFDASPGVVDALRRTFDAEVARLAFREDPDGARQHINGWVEKRTQGRIADLMPKGSIDRATELVLTDAIHFKGSWVHAFDPERTVPDAFTRADGTQVTVPFMHLEENQRFAVGRVEDRAAGVAASAVEIPYVGERASFLALVPDAPDGLAALESWMTSERLRAHVRAMDRRRIELVVPKMKLEPRLELTAPLRALGVRSAFDVERADLSRFRASERRDLAVTSAVHAAFLEVDEKGTEAAAATGVTVGRAMAQVGPSSIRLDRPFLFLIRERTAGTVLFLGRIADPTA